MTPDDLPLDHYDAEDALDAQHTADLRSLLTGLPTRPGVRR